MSGRGKGGRGGGGGKAGGSSNHGNLNPFARFHKGHGTGMTLYEIGVKGKSLMIRTGQVGKKINSSEVSKTDATIAHESFYQKLAQRIDAGWTMDTAASHFDRSKLKFNNNGDAVKKEGSSGPDSGSSGGSLLPKGTFQFSKRRPPPVSPALERSDFGASHKQLHLRVPRSADDEDDYEADDSDDDEDEEDEDEEDHSSLADDEANSGSSDDDEDDGGATSVASDHRSYVSGHSSVQSGSGRRPRRRRKKSDNSLSSHARKRKKKVAKKPPRRRSGKSKHSASQGDDHHSSSVSSYGQHRRRRKKRKRRSHGGMKKKKEEEKEDTAELLSTTLVTEDEEKRDALLHITVNGPDDSSQPEMSTDVIEQEDGYTDHPTRSHSANPHDENEEDDEDAEDGNDDSDISDDTNSSVGSSHSGRSSDDDYEMNYEEMSNVMRKAITQPLPRSIDWKPLKKWIRWDNTVDERAHYAIAGMDCRIAGSCHELLVVYMRPSIPIPTADTAGSSVSGSGSSTPSRRGRQNGGSSWGMGGGGGGKGKRGRGGRGSSSSGSSTPGKSRSKSNLQVLVRLLKLARDPEEDNAHHFHTERKVAQYLADIAKTVNHSFHLRSDVCVWPVETVYFEYKGEMKYATIQAPFLPHIDTNYVFVKIEPNSGQACHNDPAVSRYQHCFAGVTRGLNLVRDWQGYGVSHECFMEVCREVSVLNSVVEQVRNRKRPKETTCLVMIDPVLTTYSAHYENNNPTDFGMKAIDEWLDAHDCDVCRCSHLHLTPDIRFGLADMDQEFFDEKTPRKIAQQIRECRRRLGVWIGSDSETETDDAKESGRSVIADSVTGVGNGVDSDEDID